MGHISDHLRPNLTNVNATYAGPKPDDRYVLKTTAGSGSQAQGPAGCPRREIPPDGKALPLKCPGPLDFSLGDDCDASCDGVRTKTRVRKKRKTRYAAEFQQQKAVCCGARKHRCVQGVVESTYFSARKRRERCAATLSRHTPPIPSTSSKPRQPRRRRDHAQQALPGPRVSRRRSDRSEPWPRPGPTRKSPSSSSPRARSTRSAAV